MQDREMTKIKEELDEKIHNIIKTCEDSIQYFEELKKKIVLKNDFDT